MQKFGLTVVQVCCTVGFICTAGFNNNIICCCYSLQLLFFYLVVSSLTGWVLCFHDNKSSQRLPHLRGFSVLEQQPGSLKEFLSFVLPCSSRSVIEDFFNNNFLFNFFLVFLFFFSGVDWVREISQQRKEQSADKILAKADKILANELERKGGETIRKPKRTL